jgi:hypothetical protein
MAMGMAGGHDFSNEQKDHKVSSADDTFKYSLTNSHSQTRYVSPFVDEAGGQAEVPTTTTVKNEIRLEAKTNKTSHA